LLPVHKNPPPAVSLDVRFFGLDPNETFWTRPCENVLWCVDSACAVVLTTAAGITVCVWLGAYTCQHQQPTSVE